MTFGLAFIDTYGQFPEEQIPRRPRNGWPPGDAGQHGQDGFRDHGHIDDHRSPFWTPNPFKKPAIRKPGPEVPDRWWFESCW